MAEPRISKTVDKVDANNVHFDKLSTSSQSSLQILMQNLVHGKAVLKTDKDGKQFIEYQEKKLPHKRKPHPSQANKIVLPRSDVDVQQKVDACLELIQYVKDTKAPVGVSLDKTKIHLKDGKYREGDDFEFTTTKEVLGHGLFGGDIMVVKDNKTEETHALKTIMVSVFRKEEIQCWVDLTDSGYVPSLYLFKLKENAVDIHMEILHQARTIQSIIDEHLAKLNPALLKPFSLYVLDGSLEAVSIMHGKNWVHNDLHEGNIMLQKSEDKAFQLKIIDFGHAAKFDDQDEGLNHRGFRSDIRNILGMYCSVFSNTKIYDFHMTDWEAEIGNQLPEMSESDKFEILYLIKLAMDVVQPADVTDYRLTVQTQLNKALDELKISQMDALQEVAEILFPQTKQSKKHEDMDEADGLENSQGPIDVRQHSAISYKSLGPNVIMEELMARLERSMSIGPPPN